jgi:hypothetical protein
MLLVDLDLDCRNHRDDDDEEVEVMDKLIQMTWTWDGNHRKD